jgi:hypothetical protein
MWFQGDNITKIKDQDKEDMEDKKDKKEGSNNKGETTIEQVDCILFRSTG